MVETLCQWTRPELSLKWAARPINSEAKVAILSIDDHHKDEKTIKVLEKITHACTQREGHPFLFFSTVALSLSQLLDIIFL